MQALQHDPAFVRVRTSVYALRALMGDKPFAAIGKPVKKAPATAQATAKELVADQLPNGHADANADAQQPAQEPTQKPQRSSPKKRKKANDAAGGLELYEPPPLLTLEVRVS